MNENYKNKNTDNNKIEIISKINIDYTERDMSTISNEIREQLKKNRPNVTESTIRSYVSVISSLFRSIGSGKSVVEFFEKYPKQVLTALKDLPPNVRKTKLASLVSLLTHNPKSADVYRELMNKDIKVYDNRDQSKKTETEEANWITQDEVQQIFNDKYKESKHLFSKSKLTPNNFEDLQDFLIISIFHLIEPRRLKDYTDFKIRNIDPKVDNYMKGNTFVFNSYKTSKTYGQQIVKIPPLLNSIIRRWAIVNSSDFLLVGKTGYRLSQPQLTLRLNCIFGKRVSVNILRHSFLTEKYKNMPMLNEIEQTAKNMGHSIEEAMAYRKDG
jgi:hypothetical protein